MMQEAFSAIISSGDMEVLLGWDEFLYSFQRFQRWVKNILGITSL